MPSPDTREVDPHLLAILRTLGEVFGAENVARLAATLGPEPVKELADAAAEVLRLHDQGRNADDACEVLRERLYGDAPENMGYIEEEMYGPDGGDAFVDAVARALANGYGYPGAGPWENYRDDARRAIFAILSVKADHGR